MLQALTESTIFASLVTLGMRPGEAACCLPLASQIKALLH